MTAPREPHDEVSFHEPEGIEAEALPPTAPRDDAADSASIRLNSEPPPSDLAAVPREITPEAAEFLREFGARYTADEVIGKLRALRRMKVLVLGDTIVDEYHFVRPYGMPTKASVIAAQYLEAQSYAGGVLAVANHVAGFCDDVHLVTVLGAQDSKEDFVRANLRPNIRPKLFAQPGAPTTVKRRYLQKFLLQKLFEVSFFDDQPLRAELEAEVCDYLDAALADYDLVIASDFGHGCITRRMIDLLCARGRFLAVNTQLNSINYGYHVISRYPSADYVCIDEAETRMACRDRYSPIENLVRPLSRELRAQVVTVTRGHHGSLTWRAGKPFAHVPVLSRQVVDTVGAGDAFLSVAAPCAAANFPPDLVGFIGNAVGALAVRIVGNAQPVHPEMLYEFIRTLLP